MMEKQQHIPMRKHEYGFTLIELIVILGLLSTILGLSFGGYKTISTKSQKKKSEELAHKVYYSLIELITKGSFANTTYSSLKSDVVLIVSTLRPLLLKLAKTKSISP